MTQLFGDERLVCAGYGYGSDGPYLQVNKIERQQCMVLPVLGRVMSLKKLTHRFCVGPFDLESFTASACPLQTELPQINDYKDEMCPACREQTGFNPAFYNTDVISPQQRVYNSTPHFVYLAYFSPEHIKAGISSETRGIERLLEQGARYAAILERFSCAEDARTLEAALCAQSGILETMRANSKLRLLTSSLSCDEAFAQLEAVAHEQGITPMKLLDLHPYYLGEGVPFPELTLAPTSDGHDDVIAGLCIGMIGSTLLMRQSQASFAVPVKDWVSYQIEVFPGEVLREYEIDAVQHSLF